MVHGTIWIVLIKKKIIISFYRLSFNWLLKTRFGIAKEITRNDAFDIIVSKKKYLGNTKKSIILFSLKGRCFISSQHTSVSVC